MKKKKPQIRDRVRPKDNPQLAQAKKIEKMGFIGCVASVASLPASLLGFGIITAIIGLILGCKAKRSDGSRPAVAKIAIAAGIVSIVLSIPGCLVIYGTVVNPDSQFIQKLVETLVNMGGN